ncbi:MULTISPECIES: DUF2097 domain-containing protein [Methanobacterium]|uniref:DUF2097 domain-containing protein n=1 Tax=Methanobacterium bryantii TaxID=2161 RepID=A0A2A2H200_METBR|nr:MULTISPECIES: DUF2097 domain-containing protein [Methanobacterium]OEC85513.1 hypothetical protein A9507_00695 [Methanobacterium sp. A39]PAV03303.1 hypothetical protein ASJ80_04690 [Methanobacterium bryantii]
METEIILSANDVVDYVKNEVKQYDILEISYNMVYVPGEVLDIEEDEEDESLNLTLQLMGELLNDTVHLDLTQIKDDILEIRHTKTDDELVIIVIEETLK